MVGRRGLRCRGDTDPVPGVHAVPQGSGAVRDVRLTVEVVMTRPDSRWRTLVVVLAATAVIAAACGGDGGGGGDEASFEGETITFVVPFSPGGGYDSYARMVAPFLEEQLGATVVVENQDGAGGLLAINNLVAAEPDGTRIAIMNGVGAGGAAIAESESAQFKLEDLSYIGRLGASNHLFVTAADSEFETFDDVLAADGFRIGSTGPGAADYVNAYVMDQAFDMNAEIITGFEGSEENELAVTRGDVDGMTGDFDSRIKAIEEGDHRPLAIFSEEADENLPDVPPIMDFEFPDEGARDLMLSNIDLLELGRPVVAPPGVPEERLQALREALDNAVADPDLQAEAEKQGRPINYLDGDELEALVQKVNESPDHFVEAMKQAYSGA
ncbi:MAG: hypothetical protein GEU74_04960 [Nitriliruptorales bacterium]|nr:hypothetical protein [Nitriliruptorales bacterium]